MKPVILYEGKYTQADIDELQGKNSIWKIVDIHESQLAEVFEINNPKLKNSPDFQPKLAEFIKSETKDDNDLVGNWVYFPWSGVLVHTIKEEDYYLVRTNRNRNLITKEEQKVLKEFTVGVVGLSVGGNSAVSLAYQGIGNSMKLADFDSLETSNLNRVKAGLEDIGGKKALVVAHQIYEINPYADLKLYDQGLTSANLEDFINGNPKPKLIFEIIDDFKMKILLRIEAKKAGIPVIMFSNLGDSIQIDIERYDQNPETDIFNGLLGKLPNEILTDPSIDPNIYAVKLVGIESVPKRALESVKEIGNTLVGRPQLSSTVTISSGLAAYIAKCIALKIPLESGRYHIHFDGFFKK